MPTLAAGRQPSTAFRRIIPRPDPKPLYTRTTALEHVVALINSAPLVLFARRRQCEDSAAVQDLLRGARLEFRLVRLDELAQGGVMQRRLCDLTGQWTVPNLFAKSQSIGGLRAVREALALGRIAEILESDEWLELVYAIRPDALARAATVKPKSPMSFEMCLQDSHRFGYVHRERWARIKRYWGEHPEIEEYPTKHRRLDRPRMPRKW
ncbi:hypothetical protein H4R18_005805 [Coemansia javaensis]|uniref:Glutaredoxin domain-containing protein n=1 Tax=Coemansia javaensis TaxID=2761396 RepID=A0A9W8LDQ5_9FUNG|nr:hypothetical protein H4R18_005805 [Coemansia javaensis]